MATVGKLVGVFEVTFFSKRTKLSPVVRLCGVVKIAQNTTQYYNQCICIGYNIVYGVHDYI